MRLAHRLSVSFSCCLLFFHWIFFFFFVQIVEIVLRQGLVHPITCVPYLVALETDPQEVNSKLAHLLLMNMNEKYGNLIRYVAYIIFVYNGRV